MSSVIQEVERDSYCFSVYRMLKLLLQNEECKVSLNLDYFPFGSILIHSPISLAELNLKCRKDKTFRLKTCTRDIEKNEFIKWIEENSDLKIINKPVALMSIGTCSTPTKDTIKLKSGIDYSKMPQCRDNCVNEKDGVLGIKFNCTYPDRRYKAKLYSIRET